MTISPLIKIFESLSHLYHHWDDIPKTLSTKLSITLNKKLQDIANPSDISSLLWIFSKFKDLWNDMPSQSKSMILEKVHDHIMQIQNDLPKLNPANFSKILWSLAVLDISWKNDLDRNGKLLPVIKKIIDHGIKHRQFSDKSLIQLRQADINFDWELDHSIINQVKKATSKALSTHESEFERNMISHLQSILKDTDVKFQRETLIGNFTHVDVLFPQKRILEFDGSFHYNKNQELRPKDQFKQKLLEQKLQYKIVRIPQLEWMKLPFSERNNYLTNKLVDLGIFANPAESNQDKTKTSRSLNHLFFSGKNKDKPVNAQSKNSNKLG